MKKSWIICLSLILTLTLVSCGTKESNTISGQGSSIDQNLSETVSLATHIVEAEYQGFVVENPGLEFYIFSVTGIIRGNVEESEKIYVSAVIEEPENKFQEGDLYLLFLQKNDMVFYEHPVYAPLLMTSVTDQGKSYEKTLKEVKKLAEAQNGEIPDSYGIIYTKSEKLADVLAISDNVFIVKVVSAEKSELYPTSLTTCEVIDVLRSQEGTDPEESFQVGLFDGTFKVGESYVILMPSSPEAPGMYTLSSRKAVYSLDEAAEIPELAELMNH